MIARTGKNYNATDGGDGSHFQIGRKCYQKRPTTVVLGDDEMLLISAFVGDHVTNRASWSLGQKKRSALGQDWLVAARK